MKAIKYILASALTLVLAMGFSSCSDTDDYSLAEKLTGAQVYFPGQSNEKIISLAPGETTFTLDIVRRNTSEALNVPLTVTGDDVDMFDIPSSVDFAANQSSNTITGKITVDEDTFGYDTNRKFSVKIGNEDYTTPYGVDELNVTVVIAAPWATIGTAMYREDFMTRFYGVENLEYEVEIQENQLVPGYYRLVNPYCAAYEYNDPGDWDDSQDWYFEIHAEDPDHVYITTQDVGMAWSYGEFYMGSLAGYYVAKGASVAEIEAMGDYFGKLENGVITFPAGSLLIGMEDYGNGGLYTTNNNGMFRVVLPGYTAADYSLEVNYGGKYTNANNEEAGVFAELSSIGADVETVKIAVVSGKDVNAAAMGIIDGSIESVEYYAGNETSIKVPFGETPADGTYTIVAVSFANGEAQEVASSTFKYASASSHEETWSLIGTGNYTYTLYFGSNDEPSVDEGLELYVSDDDDTRYKITHWGYDVDFIFTYNSETGEVRVEENETGYTSQNYGDVYVSDLIAYTGSDSYGTSSYANGTFSFTLIYYVSAGQFGYGTETFTITSTAEAAKAAKVKKSTKVAKGIKATMAKKAAAAKKHSLKKSAVKSTFKTPSAKALKG
jgi:hypothetical protein